MLGEGLTGSAAAAGDNCRVPEALYDISNMFIRLASVESTYHVLPAERDTSVAQAAQAVPVVLVS